ncbi:MAG TPA: alanine dehydrogenase [bacterium]|nr:alanine dehydrogenase [bacterium]
MLIGIPREVKPFENRVAMPPSGIRRLIEAGAQVWIERGAGRNAGYADVDYAKVGAVLKATAKQVWQADLVLKVKEPQSSEFRFFREGLILFTFLHLAAFPKLERALKQKKVRAIPYEMIRDESGSFPILAPMSDIAGCLAALIGANYLRRDLGGKGNLLPAIGSGGTGHVTILGAGHVGRNALRVAHGLGATVTVFDKNLEKLSQLSAQFAERFQPMSDPAELPEILKRTDLLIGAVLVAGRHAPRIVTKKMVSTMEKGSVIVDVAIDQGGCIETIRPTTIKKPIFLKYGVLHYGVTNMPSMVPRTATEALARATLPYALHMVRGTFPP